MSISARGLCVVTGQLLPLGAVDKPFQCSVNLDHQCLLLRVGKERAPGPRSWLGRNMHPAAEIRVAATQLRQRICRNKDHPLGAAKLSVIWETPPLMNNALMARGDLPVGYAEAVRRLLLGLEAARFHPAAAAYPPARNFIARFVREVRPVGAP